MDGDKEAQFIQVLEQAEQVLEQAEAKILRLTNLLSQVLDDATGDTNHKAKRLWPIRSALWREIQQEIEYTYDSERAMANQPPSA